MAEEQNLKEEFREENTRGKEKEPKRLRTI